MSRRATLLGISVGSLLAAALAAPVLAGDPARTDDAPSSLVTPKAAAPGGQLPGRSAQAPYWLTPPDRSAVLPLVQGLGPQAVDPAALDPRFVATNDGSLDPGILVERDPSIDAGIYTRGRLVTPARPALPLLAPLRGYRPARLPGR